MNRNELHDSDPRLIKSRPCGHPPGFGEPDLCEFCGKPATKLCDYRGIADVRVIGGKKHASPSLFTCDALLCDDCALHVDSANTHDGADYCPKHANEFSIRTTELADAGLIWLTNHPPSCRRCHRFSPVLRACGATSEPKKAPRRVGNIDGRPKWCPLDDKK